MADKKKTVFYPLNLRHSGYIYGWKSQNVFCVAGMILCDSHEHAQALLHEASEMDDWKEVMFPDTQPSVLGRGSPSTSHPKVLLDNEDSDNCCFVFYRRPDRGRMRFYTIDPLELDVTAGDAELKVDPLLRPMRILLHSDFTKQSSMEPLRIPSLPVDQMNIALDLDYIVQRVVSGGHVAHSAPTQRLVSLLGSSIRQIWNWTRGLREICTSMLYGLCNLPAPVFRLKDLSASVQQVDVRLEQATFLPRQFRVLQSQNRGNTAYFAAHYISFNNCIWLVLNDAIVGAAFGTFLLENSELLGHFLHLYARWLSVHLIRSALGWLDHWPAGLKLNTELSRFLCLCFMSLTDFWGNGLDLSAPYFPAMLRVIGIMGRSGMTMILSLFSDLLSILTGHLYFSYLIATTIFSRQLSVAHSLWNLFRGKRHNVLRNRTDSWDYDIDQLLLGTILFTLVAFLFPTILVYYALFALARLVVILIHATLETFLAFMNHFPLFAMMLRVKDPSRLPGGVYFLTSTSSAGTMTIQVNKPSVISSITYDECRTEPADIFLAYFFSTSARVVEALSTLSPHPFTALPGDGDTLNTNISLQYKI